ncbi:MAG TPA: lamin tail domain-containing protein [Sedimentisphaerales bacterium]|nr:lamin tail domain-containing protein [Sedimentisphaerales bacterium]
MRSYSPLVSAILTTTLFWPGSVQAAGPLYINELLASNATSAKDPQGHYDDWIELYNGSDQVIDCGGMYLTDDAANPRKWQIPLDKGAMTMIPAGGYLLIWADGDVGASGLHASFGLSSSGEEVALYDKDGITLIDYVGFGTQTPDVSLGRFPDGSDQWMLFGQPTPGQKNVAVYAGIVAKPEITPEAGFYEGEIVVTISATTEGATIYYTTDGSEPYVLGGRLPTGKIYHEPLRIAQTACVRAKAIKADWKNSPVATRTYLFLQDVIRQSNPGPGWPTGSVNGQMLDFGMDPDVVNNPKYKDLIDDALLAIPTISLVTPLDNLFGATNGIYVHPSAQGDSAERPVSVELIHPDGGEGFQIDAGLRIRGGFSRSTQNPKHALRLFFRSEYGQPRLRYPLFDDEGTDEFENVDLRTSQNYSWAFQGDRQNTMVREVFSRDLQGQMGHPYTRSRYYHLYLNGHYWGLYQTQERSEASFAASYLGGEKEDFDVVKSESGSYSMVATDGNTDAYRRLYNAAIAGLADNHRYYQIQGLNLDGTRNPDYERMLDPDNLADFMIIDYYTGDRDGPGSRFVNRPNNTYCIYNRANPDGWKWFQHDNEHTLGVSQSETNLVTPFTTAGAQWPYFNPHWLHEQLARNNAEYRMLFADHIYRHFFNGGLLTPGSSIARIQNRAQQIETAIIAESARWGDAKRATPYTKQDWDSEINRIIVNYLPTRTQTVLGQFKTVGWYPSIDPPSFSQQGGYVSQGFSLLFSGGTGTVYYTLDGSDPRLVGGAVNTSKAQVYVQPIRLAASTKVKTRSLSGGVWSAANETVFAVGPVAESLRISEILYQPAGDPNAEFIELTNVGVQTINLNLVRFSKGIEYTFSHFELPAGGFCLLVRDVPAFQAQYGDGLPIAGRYSGNLNNGGERIELLDAAGGVVEALRYRDDWFSQTNGAGFSLNRADPNADGNAQGDWFAAPATPGKASH